MKWFIKVSWNNLKRDFHLLNIIIIKCSSLEKLWWLSFHINLLCLITNHFQLCEPNVNDAAWMGSYVGHNWPITTDLRHVSLMVNGTSRKTDLSVFTDHTNKTRITKYSLGDSDYDFRWGSRNVSHFLRWFLGLFLMSKSHSFFPNKKQWPKVMATNFDYEKWSIASTIYNTEFNN